MPPSAIIDTDHDQINGDYLFALEREAVWRTDDLTASGAATWTQVYDPDTDFEGDEFGAFLRVRVSYPDEIVYVTGWGREESGGDYKPFVMRSTDFGETWVLNWVDEALTAKDYTVTYAAITKGPYQDNDADPFLMKHQRIGDDIASVNPWAIATKATKISGTGTPWPEYIAGTNTIHDDSGSPVNLSTIYGDVNQAYLNPTEEAEATGWLNDYFGSGGWQLTHGLNSYPKSSSRVYVRGEDGHSNDPNDKTMMVESWVFWDAPSAEIPKAFDVARSNNNWIYLGLMDKILKSEDGGYTWSTIVSTTGAFDICVDPQAGGAIYVVETSAGQLVNLFVDGVSQSGMGGVGDSQDLDVPLRLARSLNSGRLWFLQDGTTLKMRYNGSWSDLKTGLSSARGLHAYLGDKLIFCDSQAIYKSDDGGTNITDVTGDWSAYEFGINAHRLDFGS